MKKLLMIIGIAALTQCVEARPTYTNDQYYVWSNGAMATNALNYINNSGWFPITGRNAKTGKSDPSKQKTTKWCDAVLIRVDGKFVFPRVSEEILDYLEIPEATRELFFTTFNPAVELYQNSWFPAEE